MAAAAAAQRSLAMTLFYYASTVLEYPICSDFVTRHSQRLHSLIQFVGGFHITFRYPPPGQPAVENLQFSRHQVTTGIVPRFVHMDQTDWYEVLGLKFGCDDSAIAKAYRRLALKFHPDKQKPGTDQKGRDHAEKMFERIKQASEFLSDPQKKAALDATFKAKVQHALRQKEMEAGRRSQIDKLNEAEQAYKRAKVDGARTEAESAAAHDAIRSATIAQLQKSREEGRASASTSHSTASKTPVVPRDLDSDDTMSSRAVTLSWRSAVANAANMDEATLRLQVAACGDVDSVKIRAPKKSGAHSKSAIIVFRSASSVSLCLQLFSESDLWTAHALPSCFSSAATTSKAPAPPAPVADVKPAASAPSFPAPGPGMSHAEFEAMVLQQLMQASAQQAKIN